LIIVINEKEDLSRDVILYYPANLSPLWLMGALIESSYMHWLLYWRRRVPPFSYTDHHSLANRTRGGLKLMTYSDFTFPHQSSKRFQLFGPKCGMDSPILLVNYKNNAQW